MGPGAGGGEQLEPVAQRLYATSPDRLVVLVIEVEALTAAGSLVRYDHAEPDDSSSPLYPHILRPASDRLRMPSARRRVR